MVYEAKTIANFTVNYCVKQGSPVSNLKLQKILYYLWVDYFKKQNSELYHDDICAWRLGPVVPEVYYEFCCYAGNPIKSIEPAVVFGNDIVILREIIDQYLPMSASQLVNMTHRQGSPWDIVYKDGAGNRNIIPFDLIKRLECY